MLSSEILDVSPSALLLLIRETAEQEPVVGA